MCVVRHICVSKRNWPVALFGTRGCTLFTLWCSFSLAVPLVPISWSVNDPLLALPVSMIHLCHSFYFPSNSGWHAYLSLKTRLSDGVPNLGSCFFSASLKSCGYDRRHCRWWSKKNAKMSSARSKNRELDRESVTTSKTPTSWSHRCEEHCILTPAGSDLE